MQRGLSKALSAPPHALLSVGKLSAVTAIRRLPFAAMVAFPKLTLIPEMLFVKAMLVVWV